VDVSALQRARAVIFGDQVIAACPGPRSGVVEVPCGSAPEAHLEQAAERVVDERRPVRSRHQPVLDIVDKGAVAIGGQIAVGVVGERRAAGGAILVEPVGRVGAVARIVVRPGISVIVPRAHDPHATRFRLMT